MIENKKYKNALLFIILVVIIMTAAFCTNNSTISVSSKFPTKEAIKRYNQLDSLLKYDVSQADVEIEKLYNQAKNSQDSLQLAYAYYYRTIQDKKGYRRDMNSVLLFLNKASEFVKHTQDENLKARINYEYGVYYSREDNYPRSLEYLLKAQDYFEKENHPSLSQVYNMLGSMYYMLDEMEQALAYHQKAYEIFDKRKDSIGKAMHYANTSKIYLRQKKYNVARKQLLSSLQTYKSLKDTLTVVKILTFLSDVEQNDKNITQSKDYLDQAYKLSAIFNDSVLQGHLLLHYANIYEKDNKIDKAMEFYHKGYQMTGTYHIDYPNLKNMSDIYFKTNRHKEAYAYLDKYYQIKDSVSGKDIKDKIEVLQYENKVKQQQYEKEMEEQKHKKQIYIYLIIIVSTIFVAFFIWFLYRNKTKNLEITKLKNDYLEEQLKIENQKHQLDMQSKNRELTAVSIQLLEKNKVLSELVDILQNSQNISHTAQANKLQELICQNSNQEKDWEQFRAVFQKVHPKFFNHIQTYYPQLSKTEIRICSYIKINMNNREMASLLGISHKSLISARYRIRKKLDLDQNEVLDDFVKTW